MFTVHIKINNFKFQQSFYVPNKYGWVLQLCEMRHLRQPTIPKLIEGGLVLEGHYIMGHNPQK